MHEITFTIENLIFWASALGVFCAAIVWLKKGVTPIVRPFKKIHELEEHTHACEAKFQNDNKRLDELKENDKMVMATLILLLKHAETGNCTGEMADGRKKLEDFLINKD